MPRGIPEAPEGVKEYPMTGTFSYEGLYSAGSKDEPIPRSVHAKYDFAVAYPPPETLPLDGLLEGLRIGLEREGRDLAYYPVALGSPELRELVAEKLHNDRGFRVSPDEIMLTHGSGEANALVIQALTDPGDTVITAEYVYVGTLRQLRTYGADVVGTPLDDQGIIPEAFEDLVVRLTREGRRPKYLYTIPEFQNPTGSTLPAERRRRIVDIARRHGMPILEDDCYVDLRVEGESQPSFRSFDDSGMVIHVASFSKLLAPGLRMGYVAAPDEVLRRALGFKTGGRSNQFTALAIESYLRGHLEEHEENFRPLLREKRDAMVTALGETFGGTGAKWSRPEGGCYVWLTMPEHVNLTDLQPVALEAGVGYGAGAMFAPNNNGDHCARLCFAYESPQKNREGIELLAKVLDENGAFRPAPGG